MPNSLQSTIHQLASSFAEEVLNSIRGLSLEEILAASGRGGRKGAAVGRVAAAASSKAKPAAKRRSGRLERRSPEDIEKAAHSIQALLQKNKAGLRSEQIQSALGLDKKELPRPLAFALESKLIVKKGQKRATTYFAK